MHLPKKLVYFVILFLIVSVLNNFQIRNQLPLPLQKFLPTENQHEEVKGDRITQIIEITPSITKAETSVLVTKIIDGDTIVIEGNKKLRYIGMDTPETVDPRRKVQCFGKEASEKNKELVLGKQVYLEKDISETDKYGRLLRYVYIVNEQGEKEMVNRILVQEGFAFAKSYPPDIKYQHLLQEDQRTAMNNNKGLWSNCSIKN